MTYKYIPHLPINSHEEDEENPFCYPPKIIWSGAKWDGKLTILATEKSEIPDAEGKIVLYFIVESYHTTLSGKVKTWPDLRAPDEIEKAIYEAYQNLVLQKKSMEKECLVH